MSILPSNANIEQNEISNSFKNFYQLFAVGKILRACNCVKLRGIPFFEMFAFIFLNVFQDRSVYMQYLTGKPVLCSKNTYYRFFLNQHANWLRFTTLLSETIINTHIRRLTAENRSDCFVVDDSLYERVGYKKTELASRVFDHVSMTYKKGYRMLTLGWTDGCTFLPINFSLLSSSKEKQILGTIKKHDKRTIAGKRRIMAQSKGTDVMISLIEKAIKEGHKAKYVLFDSWFSTPHQIVQLKDMGLDTIAMIKTNGNTSYEFDGKRMNIKQIYGTCKKRHGRSRYLLSIAVKIGKNKQDEHPIDARIVCVRNRTNRKDWLALVCTDMSLSEEEIIRIYGKRWDIEVFFKTCKSHLKLTTEYHGLSYDALTAHVAIIFTRYMYISVCKRNSEDERTLGELFYIMVDELADISFSQSMAILVDVLMSSIAEVFHATEEQITLFTDAFFNQLPKPLKDALLGSRKLQSA